MLRIICCLSIVLTLLLSSCAKEPEEKLEIQSDFVRNPAAAWKWQKPMRDIIVKQIACSTTPTGRI